MSPFSIDKIEPIAIIGIGCRFPGANNPLEFWNFLCSGHDAIRDVPKDRWNIDRFYSSDPNKPGKMYVRKGGFLQKSLDRFDAAFFGISPREAVYMDPQQRFLLEVAWEAMEDAGVIPNELAGTDTGVYIGGFTQDSLLLQMSPLNRKKLSTHSAAGASMTMLSNRLSYCYDFRGPSVSVDTACSSSLVAVHLACQALWKGECSLALAGGANIMLRPEYPIIMSKGQFLAPDGYCKSFDARANGYARGEGTGIVVLKPYKVAMRDGDVIYALVRGTGINQDGRTEGITVPNPDSQEMLIRQIYDQSEVPLNKVVYIEAHGTGTAVGDLIEATVLGRTIGAGRKKGDECVVGSVKAAIGHLEAAAGIAGLIKATLCAYHGQIPPQANLKTPNPKIPFDALGLRLPVQLQSMPDGEPPLFVGVNSFGYGGTNAHVILEQLPSTSGISRQSEEGTRPHVLPLSARDPKALKALASSYGDWLSKTDTPTLLDVCYSVSTRRAHHDHRLAVVADSIEAMKAELLCFAEKGRSERVRIGRVLPQSQKKLVFVFTGMGPQWWAMGRELLENETVFQQTAMKVDQVFQSVAGWSVLAEMHADMEHSNIKRTQVAQTTNFLLQVALADLLGSWGLQPTAIVGHSIGEVSAAYVSGALDLEDAVLVSYHRSRLQQQAAGKGLMLATGLGLQDARALIASRETLISIAAVNSPGAVTLSGDAEMLAAISAELEQKGIFNRFLQVEVPYHSLHMEPLKPEFREVLRDLSPRSPSVPLYSTVTGRLVEGVVHDAEYWCNNIREPVLFADAINNIVAQGYFDFIEVGPHPVLSNSIKEVVRQAGVESNVFTCLRREQPERETLLMALAGLYVNGFAIEWQALFKEGAYVKLPSYPWQREKFWSESKAASTDRLGCIDHPLLGMRVSGPLPTWRCENNSDDLEYLHDHVIEGMTVYPGAAYVEQGLAIKSLLEGTDAGVIEDMKFHQALVVSSGKEPMMCTTFDKDTREYRIYSGQEGDTSEWTLHASGRISPASPFPAQSVPLNEIRIRCAGNIDVKGFYKKLSTLRLEYGPSFQGIQRLWWQSGEVLAQIESSKQQKCSSEKYQLYPTLLDASIQSLIALIDEDVINGQPFMPVSIRRVSCYSKLNGPCWSYGQLIRQAADGIEADIVLCDEHGNVTAEVLGLRCQPIVSAKVADRVDWVKDRSYVPVWEKAERATGSEHSSRWMLFMDDSGSGAELARVMNAYGVTKVTKITTGEFFGEGDFTALKNGEGVKQLEQILAKSGDCDGILYLWTLDEVVDTEDPTQSFATIWFLRLVQALARRSGNQATRLYVVTRGAQGVVEHEQVLGLKQAPVVGLARTALSEHPDLRCTLIDLGSTSGSEAVSDLAEEILSDSPETEIALRGSDRYVYRLIPLSQLEDAGEANEEATLTATYSESFCLEIGTPGRIESMRFRQTCRQLPDVGEVELHIHAAALNFKDVLKVLGMLPAAALEDAYHGSSLGMEAAGVITAIGEGVTDYQVGDAIVASVRNSFSSHVRVPVEDIFAVPMLETMSFTDAASLPVIFMTAYYALHELAHLRKGETVLIHAAAGGVGLAAIQVAQWLGAKIIATAGSAKKRDYLRSLGIEHILNSRTLEFADQVMKLTGGRGVDVVLNSISGETFLKSLAIVAPLGRFIEIGKRDIVENSKLPMLPFNRNLSFMAIDLDRMMTERPDLIRRLLQNVWDRFREGDFVVPPIEVFPVGRISEAFRHMAQSKQIGKIVISFEDLNGVSIIPLKEDKLFKVDASYMITGGFGGFGLKVAQWMAKEGARHLVLIGRNGAKTVEAQQILYELKKQGVTVKAHSMDIGQERQVADLLSETDQTMPPLRGIVHAAGVLDDAFLINLDETRLLRVMEPKARGAWLLHKYAKELPIDFFVLFSSVSSLIGNSGQGNYVAANVFLDTIAHHRHALGLPAVSINWGVLAEVGMAAKDKDLAEHLGRVGIKAIAPVDAMAALAAAIESKSPQIGFMDVDWSKWRQSHSAAAKAPKFEHILSHDAMDQDSAMDNIRAALLSANAKDRPEMLALIIAELVAETMHMPSEKIDIYRSLTKLGIDSLMAVELQVSIQQSLGIELSVLELVKGESILVLACELLSRMSIQIEPDLPKTMNTMSEPQVRDEVADAVAASSNLDLKEAWKAL